MGGNKIRFVREIGLRRAFALLNKNIDIAITNANIAK